MVEKGPKTAHEGTLSPLFCCILLATIFFTLFFEVIRNVAICNLVLSGISDSRMGSILLAIGYPPRFTQPPGGLWGADWQEQHPWRVEDADVGC